MSTSVLFHSHFVALKKKKKITVLGAVMIIRLHLHFAVHLLFEKLRVGVNLTVDSLAIDISKHEAGVMFQMCMECTLYEVCHLM